LALLVHHLNNRLVNLGDIELCSDEKLGLDRGEWLDSNASSILLSAYLGEPVLERRLGIIDRSG
jgi:hypothetical protein